MAKAGFMLAVRNILFALLVPGTVTVVIPWFIAHRDRVGPFSQWTPWHYLGLLPLATGVAILFWCIRDFAVVGRGTLAPIDPPKVLVARGPYRYVRNPMYIGVMLILLGEAGLFESVGMLIYAAVFLAAAHGFVTFYEEPVLRRKFGESYGAYCRRVHRWRPRLHD